MIHDTTALIERLHRLNRMQSAADAYQQYLKQQRQRLGLFIPAQQRSPETLPGTEVC